MSSPFTPKPSAIRVPGHGGVHINVWDYGGEGAPLLLCHCTGAMARIWDPIVARLGGRFRVIAPDSRGHGDSDKPSVRAAYDWAHSGHDLLAVVDALQLDAPIAAAGHSAGGAHIAYAETFRPGTFGPVMFMDAIIPPPGTAERDNPLARGARKRKSLFASREDARARFLSKPPMDAWATEMLDAYIEHGLAEHADGVTLKCPAGIETWIYEWVADSELFNRLPELDFKASIIAGSDSDVLELVHLQADALPNARLRTLDAAGHFIPQEKPAETADLLLEWFTQE